jgi:glycosyltransferase involved in cell wall biosynthesis
MINYSVIIPHYNVPELLGRCLRSIPERDDVQVIVVDDNSPGNENYLRDIPELSRKNVEFYVTKDGMGAGHARNIGLSHAVGKWLVFSDSDDFFVENFSEILDEYVDDSHDIIYFNSIRCDSYDTTIIYKKRGKSHLFKKYYDTGNDMYLRICFTEPWGKLWKRRLVTDNDISFQETKAHNDLLFAVKAGLFADTVMIVDRPLYWYGVREGSLGHPKGAEPFEKICDRVRAWHDTQLLLESQGIKTKIYLPVITCMRASGKKKDVYFKLLAYIKENNMRLGSTLWGTLKFFCYKIYNKSSLSFANLLVASTLDSFKKRHKTN